MAQKKVEKVFIAKDISRTGSLVIGGASENIVNGEVVILDKNKNILSAGATIADTDEIYVVEGLSTTYSYVTPDGTSVTGVRKLLTSDAIQGAAVINWSSKAYSVAVETVSTLSGALTPVVGEQYSLRFIYKDVHEHPGQFTYTYYVTATVATRESLYGLFVTAINKRPERRIQATYAANVLTLTALPYDDNTAIDSIDEYNQVNFDVILYSENYDTVAITKTVNPFPGSGTYRKVRDEEKWSQGYEGLLNRTNFPTQVPTFRTVLDETYDCLVIDHKNWYTASDNREEQVDVTTKIYVPNTATSNQATDILAALNPWMASTPKAFATVTL